MPAILKAMPYEPEALEELACQKMQALPHGSGFHAYALIVNKVQAVQRAEDLAARARFNTVQFLSQDQGA